MSDKPTVERAPDCFIGRQPIFDAQSQVYGYELLYRDDEQNRARFDDASVAMSDTTIHAFLDIGIDQLVGTRPAFINMTRDVLLGETWRALPPSRVVFEILETELVDQLLVERVAELRAGGYRFALDDFAAGPDCPLLELVDIVKIDILAARDIAALRRQVEPLRGRSLTLLAEKVETDEQLRACKELGFELFQGYFLCRPAVVKKTRMPTNRAVTLALLARLHDPEVEPRDIENSVQCDVSLSYKLLRLVNSPWFALAAPVESIRQAIVLLGLDRVRAWVSLLAMAKVDDKPRELMVTAMVRAHMCAELSRAHGLRSSDPYFTVGLFSLLDALMDRPLQELIADLPLTEEVVQALLHQVGPLGSALRCAIAYERGRWQELSELAIGDRLIRQAYMRSLRFADTLAQAL